MGRTVIFNADGSIVSTKDSDAPSPSASTSTPSSGGSNSNGATGVIAASSITNSGDTTLQGALSVQGASTLSGGASIAGLTTTGQTRLQGGVVVSGVLQASGGLNALNASVTGDVGIGGKLTVTGASTLASTQVTDLKATGTATLAAVNAGALSVTSFTNSGSTTITGNFTAGGSLNGAALAITLPASGASSTPILLKSNGGATLLAVDASGNATLGGITTTSISNSGAQSIAGNLSVGGTSTLTGAVNCTSINANAAIAAATLSSTGTLNVGGVSTLAATNVASLVATGQVTAKNVTLSSGGVFTFADGSTLASAPAGTGGTPLVLQGSGPPNASTAPNVQIGQLYFDSLNGIIYSPSTKNDFTGFAGPYFNVQGQTGPQGPTTSYRGSVKGFVWLGSATAGTQYPVNITDSLSSTGGYFPDPVKEVMPSAGTLTAVSISTGGNNSAAPQTAITVLKNGTAIYTASNVAQLPSANPSVAGGFAKPTSAISFAAGDILTMTVAFSVTSSVNCQVTLHYTLNS